MFIGGSGTFKELSDSDEKLANQGMIAIHVVVKAFNFEVAIQIPIAQCSHRDGELIPHGIAIVVDMFGLVNHSVSATFVGSVETQERIRAAKPI